MWEWVASLGIGGDPCVDRELRSWLDRAPMVEYAREDLRRWLVGRMLEQFEQSTGLSANTEAVEVADEYWRPLIEPAVAERWAALREPALGWLSERVSCRTAYRLARDRTSLDQATAEGFLRFWEESLDQPEQALALREALGRLSDDWGEGFSREVREVLPGPPNAAEP